MGLDMYAYRAKFQPESEVDFNEPETSEQIMYWRKHPDLHGWMEELYFEKGGVSEFNCRPVILTKEDLDNLALAIVDSNLPKTTGFFFGNSDGEEYHEDLNFCKKAIKFIEDGWTIWYRAWW